MADMVKHEPDERIGDSARVKQEAGAALPGPIVSSNAHSFATDGSSPFAWEKGAESISERVAIKQKALEDAFSNAKSIVDLLDSALGGGDAGASRVQRDPEIQAWKEEIDQLRQQHKSLEILVGVAGATGAGKSTILNMLLGRPHLLPSSNSEASTASACQVKYNHDDSPNHLFRAEVECHTYKEVLYEVTKLHEAFNMVGNFDEETLSSQVEEMEAQNNNEAYISEELKKINAIWRLDREQVQAMTPEALLASNKHVRSLLGSTQHISSADSKEFAAVIKPYVDCSPTPQGFEVWPLVKQVKLFIKCDMLKEGITLVDLPGLSDAVESRARVAQRSFEQLDTTIIVTRSIRAIDEKTGVDLMNDYQALQMQANGTFKKKQFCVVASQMDEIDVEGFRLGSAKAKADVQLQRDMEEIERLTSEEVNTKRELRAMSKRTEALERTLEKATRRLKTLEAKEDAKRAPKAEASYREKLDNAQKRVHQIRAQLSDIQKGSNQLHRTLHELDESLKTCKGRANWACIRMRHEHIAQRIKENMKEKLLPSQTLVQGVKTNSHTEGVVEVFSVSAKAYRDHLAIRPPANFPDTSYTGIPQLKAWLRTSALWKREAHLDLLLKALQRLLNGIRQWSNIKRGRPTATFSKKNIREVLSVVHEKRKKDLDNILHEWIMFIRNIDPFADLKREVLVSKESVGMAVLKWAYKCPEDPTKTAYMAHGTYDAILRRDGGPFTSRGLERRSYDFTEALAVVFLRVMSGSWQTVLQKYIPSHEPLIMKSIEAMWHPYINELVDETKRMAPALLPQLLECVPDLVRVFEEMQLDVRQLLSHLAKSSSRTQPEFRDALQDCLTPLYRHALEFTGPGCFKRRRDFLQQHVVESMRPMLDSSSQKMERKYLEDRQQVLFSFLAIPRISVDKVKNRIDLLLATSKKAMKKEARSDTPHHHHKEETDDVTIGLKQKVAAVAKEWEQKWRCPGGVEVISDESLELPVEYVRRSHDLGDTEEDSDEEEEEDDDSDDEDIDMDEDGQEDGEHD